MHLKVELTRRLSQFKFSNGIVFDCISNLILIQLIYNLNKYQSYASHSFMNNRMNEEDTKHMLMMDSKINKYFLSICY